MHLWYEKKDSWFYHIGSPYKQIATYCVWAETPIRTRLTFFEVNLFIQTFRSFRKSDWSSRLETNRHRKPDQLHEESLGKRTSRSHRGRRSLLRHQVKLLKSFFIENYSFWMFNVCAKWTHIFNCTDTLRVSVYISFIDPYIGEVQERGHIIGLPGNIKFKKNAIKN